MPQHGSLGRIEIFAIQGRNMKNCETFKKQDPYLSYKLGESRGRTKSHHSGGTNPTWNELTRLDVTPQTYKLRLRAYDDDLIGKDFIGETTIDISPAICSGELDGWFPLYSDSEPAGEVYLEFTFHHKA